MTIPGIYTHYKGGLYRVLFVAHDSTNGRLKPSGQRHRVVVYVSMVTGEMCTRDETEFHEDVRSNGEDVPRFKLWKGVA